MGEWALEPHLTRFLEAGGGEWIDVYAFHYYGLANPPILTPEVEKCLSGEETLGRMRRALVRFRRGGEPISVPWQDPRIRQDPVWVRPRGIVRGLDFYGDEVSSFGGTFRLDWGIEPVYLAGEVDEILTHPPALQASP